MIIQASCQVANHALCMFFDYTDVLLVLLLVHYAFDILSSPTLVYTILNEDTIANLHMLKGCFKVGNRP